MANELRKSRLFAELNRIWNEYSPATLEELQQVYECYCKFDDETEWQKYFVTFSEFATAACESDMKAAVKKMFQLGLSRETIREILQQVIDSENRTLAATAAGSR